jgi:dihydroorotase
VQFERVMAIQVHMGTTPDMIADAFTEGGRRYKVPPSVRLAKCYLEKVTNSPIGISEEDVLSDYMMSNFEELAKWGMILSVHPEVFRGDGELFCCEEAFIPILEKLSRRLPELTISVEHISKRVLLEAVLALDNVVGSFTIHHLVGDIADFWRDGVVYDPFNFCRSVLRSFEDRLALLAAIADPVKRRKLFLGLDDAPHLRSTKLEKGSPGIWVPAPFAPLLLLEVCEEHEIPLEAVIDVACLNGPRIYGLTVPDREVRFKRSDIVIPDLYPIGGGAPIYGKIPNETNGVVPYKPGHVCKWQIVPVAT